MMEDIKDEILEMEIDEMIPEELIVEEVHIPESATDEEVESIVGTLEEEILEELMNNTEEGEE